MVMMTRRRAISSSSSPPLAVLLLLLCNMAAARLLTHRHQGYPVNLTPAVTEGGVVVKAAGGPALQGGVINGDKVVDSDAMTAEDSCEEGLQRRLLHDAHLDYIYTQHKGKP